MLRVRATAASTILRVAFLMPVALIWHCNEKRRLDVGFRIKDTTPPQVVSITPVNGATEVSDLPTVTVVFNEPMDANSLNSSTFRLTRNGTIVGGTLLYDGALRKLSFTVGNRLSLNSSYALTLTTGAKDLAGNALAVPYASAFTTDVCPSPSPTQPKLGFDGEVKAMIKIGCVIYVGGSFSSVGVETGSGVVLNSATGRIEFGVTHLPIQGQVYSVISDGASGWYIGGNFTKIGNFPRRGLAHIMADGSLDSWAPEISTTGVVNSLAIANGIVYAGGSFNTINGFARRNFAAIGSDGSLKEWGSNINGTVLTVAISGQIIYLGGGFDCLGNCPGGTEGVDKWSRSYIAAIDMMSGIPTSWAPDANGGVFALAISGTRIYAGGSFTSIGGQSRNRISALDTTLDTNNATAWDPNANGVVSALTISGTVIYAGGSFTSIGGQSRNRISALDTTLDTNNATAWNPGANGSVFSLAITGTTVYAGGNFTSIGGQNIRYLAALDTTQNANNATTWNPNLNADCRALAISGATIYAGGVFGTINLVNRDRLAAISTDGILQSWNPIANSNIRALAGADNVVYAGGEFTCLGTINTGPTCTGGTNRNYIAAVTVDGTLLPWNPNANGVVSTFAVSGTTIYAGGSFTSIGGQNRTNIAALQVSTGTATAWNPNVNGPIQTLLASGNIVYAGGGFNAMNNAPTSCPTAPAIRNNLAAMDTDGCATFWNPNADGTVNALDIFESTIYAGGNFLNIGSTERHRLAAIRLDGSLQPWNPNVADSNSAVGMIRIFNNSIYVSGIFCTVVNKARSRIAAIGLDGSLLPWNPSVGINNSGKVNSMVMAAGGILFVGGDFYALGEVTQNRFAILPADDGTSWPEWQLPCTVDDP